MYKMIEAYFKIKVAKLIENYLDGDYIRGHLKKIIDDGFFDLIFGHK